MVKTTLVLAADSNYLDYAITLLHQIRSEERGNYAGHVSLITPAGTDLFPYKSHLNLVANNFSHLSVNFENYKELKLSASHLSESTYSRLFLEELIPVTFDKCLYLDVDLLINSDLNELLSIEFEQTLMALPYEAIPTSNSIFEPGTKYFNAGVMLIDMQKWRKEQVLKKCLHMVSQYGPFEYADQDVLNLVMVNKWQPLGQTFNYLFPPPTSSAKLKRPQIVHFAGSGKPWNRANGGSFGRQWRKTHRQLFPDFKLGRYAYLIELRINIREILHKAWWPLYRSLRSRWQK